MTAAASKNWLAFGTGIGIEAGRSDLNVTVARVRPGGAKVLGSLTIHNFRDQPAAEWGEVYSSFIRKLGARHLAARVLLPREEVVVRQIQLPGVADRDLDAAIRFQIDSLHPFAEDEAVWGWSRIGKTPSVLVGIAPREVMDRYRTLFAEAAVKVTSFTVSAATVYKALRLYSTPAPDGLLALEPTGDEWEVYGESPARPVFSARLDQSFERARALALAELRLAPETEPVLLHDALPQPVAAPADYQVSESTLSYATALSGAMPWSGLAVNLLPRDMRQASSRLIYLPTIILAVLVALTLGAMAAYSSYETRDYSAFLQGQIRKVEPQARKAAEIDKQIALIRNRGQVLDNFRRHSKDDLDALNELTRILQPPSWLTSLQLTRDSLSLSGQTDHAEGLLKELDGSKQFRRSSFTLPMSRVNNAESFSIHASREGIAP